MKLKVEDITPGMSVRISKLWTGMRDTLGRLDVLGKTLTVTKTTGSGCSASVHFKEVPWTCGVGCIEAGGMTKEYVQKQIDGLKAALDKMHNTQRCMDRLEKSEITNSEINALALIDTMENSYHEDLRAKVKKIIKVTNTKR